MPYKETTPWHAAQRRYLASKRHLSTESATNYRSWLRTAGKSLHWKDPRLITLDELREWESHLKGKETSRSNISRVLKAFLVRSGNKKAAEWDVMNHARPKQDGIFLNEGQVAHVRQMARSLGPLVETLASLGMDNGLRAVDMQRLTLQNALELLNFGRSEIMGKGRNGGKCGLMILNTNTRQPLKDYLEERRKLIEQHPTSTDALLLVRVGQNVRPVSYEVISLRMDRLSKLSGIVFHCHDLRRTFGNRLHRAGVPIETIAKLMRHENINQAFRSYIGIDSDEMTAAMSKLG